MKNILYTFIIIITLAYVAGCTKSDGTVTGPRLVSKDSLISFVPAGGSKTTSILQVASDTNETWSIYGAGKDTTMPAWLTVTPRGGRGTNSASVSLVASENVSVPGGKRNVILTVVSSNPQRSPLYINVTQDYNAAYDITAKITDTAARRISVNKWGDGYSINITQAAKADSLDVSGLKVASLAGLNYFSNLTYINCSGSTNAAFTSIDVTANAALKTLLCKNNSKLKSIDISKNQVLTTLDCTNCAALTTIYVWSGFTAPAGFQIPVAAAYLVKPQ